MAAPRNVPLTDADRVFRLPPGVTGAWVEQGLVRPVWFVWKGTIVRGVATAEMVAMLCAIRSAKIRRARERVTSVASR